MIPNRHNLATETTSVDSTLIKPKPNTRVFVISDIHLGGEPAMMSRPYLLESFIDHLPSQLRADEALELVIAGDFIDFLAVEPYADFVSNPADVIKKLESVTTPSSASGCVFDALGRHVRAGHRLTIMVGNHDVEMALPSAQAYLLSRIGAKSHELHFVDDGRAYRIGGALIEHGNAYDGANANDWNGLRHVASSESRSRKPDTTVRPSAGSQLVTSVVNHLKNRYPFIAKLQPEGELLALLLLALEPQLRFEFGKIVSIFSTNILASAPPIAGERPISSKVSTKSDLDFELLDAFGDAYEALLSPSNKNISATTAWLRSWVKPNSESLGEVIRKGDPIPETRLKQLRVAMKKLLGNEASNCVDGPADQYSDEAKRMLSAIYGLDAVVMGHTHLPRCKHYNDGIYINCGTWIDRFPVPSQALVDESGKELEIFLRQLISQNNVGVLDPTYAELLIASNSQVTQAELKVYKGSQ